MRKQRTSRLVPILLSTALCLYSTQGWALEASATSSPSATMAKDDGQVVKGKVVDENGEELPGARVVLKGGDYQGTVTDAKGNFSLGLGKIIDMLVP